MHLSVANPLVRLKDPLRQHIFKELYSRYRKITVHVLYIYHIIYMEGTLNFLQKKNKKHFQINYLRESSTGFVTKEGTWNKKKYS